MLRTATKLAPVAPQVKGTASLVYFYYGDSAFITLAQETLHLKKAMSDYGTKILLKDDYLPNMVDLSNADEKEADVVDLPTRENFFKYLRQLAAEGNMIDLWIFSHGSPGAMLSSRGQHGTQDYIRAADIQAELSPEKTGLTQMPIRMIWSTLCFAETLNQAWLSVGTKVVGGSRFVNYYPNQFRTFSEEWNKGNVSYATAVSRSDNAASRTLVQTYMLANALKTRGTWGGCRIGKTVLGVDPCAKDYFTTIWHHPADKWRDDMSGKENMNFSSEKIIVGQQSLRKSDIPSWE